MVSEWQVHRLGDIVDIYDGPHATPHKIATGPIFLGISNLVGGRLDLSSTAHLSEEDYIKWTRRVTPQEGDIVFSYETRLGEAAIIPAGLRCCLGRRMGLLRVKGDQVDSRFLLYAYLGAEFQGTIRARTVHGSTVDRIPLVEMPDFPIRLPSLKTQQAIARILGTLDDKIELNRRMNQTLEEIARAIFKSWFVDFDPVRAKAAGQQPPGLPPHIADLFPDAFEESELGKIPKGWEIWRVADVGEVICGKTPSTKVPEYYGDDVPFIRIPDMHGKIFAAETRKILSLAGAASQENKTLPAGSICVSCIGTTGLVIITTQESQTNQQINSVIPKSPNETYFWYWSFLGLRDEIKARGSGGSVLTNLSTGRFSQLEIQSPPASLRRRYDALVRPHFERILSNDRESGNLAALRDTLLPKLISGELRVPDARP